MGFWELDFEALERFCGAIGAAGVSADECAEAMNRLADVLRRSAAVRYIRGFAKNAMYITNPFCSPTSVSRALPAWQTGGPVCITSGIIVKRNSNMPL